MNKKLITASIILALGVSGKAAQASGNGQISGGQNQSRVGLLLPAVQKIRESAKSSSATPD